MKIIQQVADWRQLQHQELTGQSLGFIPTMGCLHDGHMSLVKQSLAENDKTIVSIFVNPHQFNQNEDFLHYPRQIETDCDLLIQHGVDFCFLPNPETLYPDNFLYQIHAETKHPVMEEAHRPGHFAGVLTVVMKLLQIIQPNKAYFGEKDFQQLQLIKGMVANFFIPCEIIGSPTLREASGLPFSSRNQRLSKKQRQKAEKFAKIFHKETSQEAIRHQLIEAGLKIDYLEQQQGRLFVAVWIDDIRLIDNRFFKDKKWHHIFSPEACTTDSSR